MRCSSCSAVAAPRILPGEPLPVWYHHQLPGMRSSALQETSLAGTTHGCRVVSSAVLHAGLRTWSGSALGSPGKSG